VSEGGTAVFSVAVDGPGLEYQWQTRSGSGGEWADIPNATAASITVASAKLSDNGRQYRCRLDNADGTALTAAATLGVLRVLPDAAEIAEGVTAVSALTPGQAQLLLPGVPDGYAIAIKSSSDTSSIALSGAVTPSYKDKEVTLVFEVTKTLDGTKALTSPIAVTVPRAQLSTLYTPQEVADNIWYTTPDILVTHDGTELPVPWVPDDFEIYVYSANPSGVIGLDESVAPPPADTEVEVVFLVIDMRDGRTALTRPIRVTVQGRTAFPLEGITLSPSNLVAKAGATGRFAAGFFPANTTDARGVSYTVQPAGVISVAQDGSYRALKEGHAVVTATSSVGGHKAFCTVAVQSQGGGQTTTQGGIDKPVDIAPVAKLATPLKKVYLKS
jgi:hypothetical protein